MINRYYQKREEKKYVKDVRWQKVRDRYKNLPKEKKQKLRE